jgi:acetyl esterase/lipase
VAVQLWPDEYEDLREEAREMVGSLLTGLAEGAFGAGDIPADASREEKVRRSREAMVAFFAPVPEAEVREIAGVPCRVFLPEGPATAVYLHFHGGGMMIGAPEMNDTGNLALARHHGLAVVSVDYRLAPEHPWPAGPDDGVAVAAWLLEHAEAEFASSRLLLGGESAGGYMAAAVALRIRDELDAIDRVIGLELVFGVYDWGRSPSQRGLRPYRGPDLLDPDGILFFTECYLPGRTDDERRDPAVSPAFADLAGMPPARFSVGTGDHLCDDTLWLASRWVAAGGEADVWVGPDLPHGFMWFPCELTKRWQAHMDDWFRRHL